MARECSCEHCRALVLGIMIRSTASCGTCILLPRLKNDEAFSGIRFCVGLGSNRPAIADIDCVAFYENTT